MAGGAWWVGIKSPNPVIVEIIDGATEGESVNIVGIMNVIIQSEDGLFTTLMNCVEGSTLDRAAFAVRFCNRMGWGMTDGV